MFFHPSGPEPGASAFAGLHRAWATRLAHEFDVANYLYLGSRLSRPSFRIGFDVARLGFWDGAARCITVAESHILGHSWHEVCRTLRHEMAHQWVDDALGPGGEPPHGPAFAHACRLLRVTPEATARGLQALDASSAPEDALLARIRKLMALAGSPNEHEAANAMRTANRLMLEYNVDRMKVSARRDYHTRVLGEPAARIQQYRYALADLLHDHFFVEVIWIGSFDPRTCRAGHVLEITGTPTNLELASYVHDFVMNVAEPLWREHRRTHPGGRGTRLQYLAGLVAGLKSKLDRQREEVRSSNAIVWSGDPGLDAHFRWLNPRIRHTSTRGVSCSDRYAAGRGDGAALSIRPGVGAPASSQGRLLGPGR